MTMRQKEAMDHNNNKKRRPCQYNSIGLQYKFWDKLRSSSEINGRKKKEEGLRDKQWQLVCCVARVRLHQSLNLYKKNQRVVAAATLVRFSRWSLWSSLNVNINPPHLRQ